VTITLKTNDWATTTQGIDHPILYRMPPPTLFDEDDPIIEPAARLRDQVKRFADLISNEVPEEWYQAHVFWCMLDELVRRDADSIARRARILDRLMDKPAKPGEQHYTQFDRLLSHPGKELPYRAYNPWGIPFAQRCPNMAPNPDDPPAIAAARALFEPVDELANYTEQRFLDWEMMMCWTMLRSLNDIIGHHESVEARQKALRARLIEKNLPLAGRPND